MIDHRDSFVTRAEFREMIDNATPLLPSEIELPEPTLRQPERWSLAAVQSFLIHHVGRIGVSAGRTTLR